MYRIVYYCLCSVMPINYLHIRCALFRIDEDLSSSESLLFYH